MYTWLSYTNLFYENGLILNGADLLRPFWFVILAIISHPYHWLSSILQIELISINTLPTSMDPGWGIQYIPDPIFNYLVKTPMILGDTGVTLSLYKLGQYYGRDSGNKAAMMYYLNPAIIWISSSWGQYDSLPVMFAIFSIYLIIRSRPTLSSISLLGATMLKWYAFAPIIPITVYLIKNKEKIHLIKFFVPIITIGLIYGILIPIDSLQTIVKFLSPWINAESGISGFGLTYWSTSLLYPISIELSSTIYIIAFLTFGITTLVAICLLKTKKALDFFVVANILLALTFFLSYRYVTEQRFVWLASFLILLVVGGRLNGKIFWSMSILAIIYAQKNFPHYLLPIEYFTSGTIHPLFIVTETMRTVQEGALMPTGVSALILTVLGSSFSILSLIIYFKSVRPVLTQSYINMNSIPKVLVSKSRVVMSYLKGNMGAPFVGAFIIILSVIIISLAIGKGEGIDEMLTYAYYLLVIGIILQLITYLRHSWKKDTKKEKTEITQE